MSHHDKSRLNAAIGALAIERSMMGDLDCFVRNSKAITRILASDTHCDEDKFYLIGQVVDGDFWEEGHG